MGRLNKDQLTARRKQLRLDAQRELAKTEVLQFRIDENAINRIHARADREQIAVGTMLRKWIMERLSVEETEETQKYEYPHQNTALMVKEALKEEQSYWKEIKRLNEVILQELRQLRSEQK